MNYQGEETPADTPDDEKRPSRYEYATKWSEVTCMIEHVGIVWVQYGCLLGRQLGYQFQQNIRLSKFTHHPTASPTIKEAFEYQRKNERFVTITFRFNVYERVSLREYSRQQLLVSYWYHRGESKQRVDESEGEGNRESSKEKKVRCSTSREERNRTGTVCVLADRCCQCVSVVSVC